MSDVLNHFESMIDHCVDYVARAKAEGRPVVGIMCEFTPREIILAAGGVPVCLCGGAAHTIPLAEQVLPSNLCPLIKSTFGYHLKGGNPFLEAASLIVAETTCDGKKKMFELMGATRQMYVLELPQKADDPGSLARWEAEVRKLKAELERRFGVEITQNKLRAAIALMNRERRLRRELAGLMEEDDPPFTGRQLLDLKSVISGIEADLAQYERAIHALRNRDQDGRDSGLRAARPVRVLLTGVPLVHGAERVVELLEDCGGLVVCMENCTGLKPILEDVAEDADPLAAVARKYFHLPCSVLTPNSGRFDSLRHLAERYRPECVVELVWHACLTYDVESAQVREFVEEQLRVPYLKLTTDYSPADSARITARVEALYEIVRERRDR